MVRSASSGSTSRWPKTGAHSSIALGVGVVRVLGRVPQHAGAVRRVVEPRLGLDGPGRARRPWLICRDLAADRGLGRSVGRVGGRAGRRVTSATVRQSRRGLRRRSARFRSVEDWPAMAGNSSRPGASVTSRALALLGAFDERPPAAHPHRAGGARRAAAAHRAPAGRRAGRLGRAGPHAAPASTSMGRRLWDLGPARAGADRAARAGLAVPPRPLRRHAGHRAPRGPRRHRGALPRPAARATRRCRSSARSARGCRCTPPGSARCCWPTPRPTVQARCWRALTRVTPYTITQPGLLRRQLARVRRDGYATTVEEMSLGACSVAVPIRRGDRGRGRARHRGARRCAPDRPRLVAALQVAAQGIGRLLPEGDDGAPPVTAGSARTAAGS